MKQAYEKLNLDICADIAVDNDNPNCPPQFSCVDLFAGAGGLSLAAMNIGFNVVAAIEINKHACDTYAANLVENGAPRVYNQNIQSLDPAVLTQNHFSNGEECDLILGGPPCQGFSTHRINDSGVKDPRNDLIFSYFQFVRYLQPKVFLMENVSGMLWERHKPFLEKFYLEGQEAGYNVLSPIVLDARDFGLPQRRKRVFVLGVRNDIGLDINWPPKPTHGNEKNRSKNERLLPWVSSESIFEVPAPSGDINDIHMNHTPELVKRFMDTPINGGSRKDSKYILPCHKKHDGHKDVYGRINPSQPGPTMTTACINPSKGRFVHPTEPHGITVRQAARFQTFPDWFTFKGGLIASGEQIGNAVPIELGEKLLIEIRDGLVLRAGEIND